MRKADVCGIYRIVSKIHPDRCYIGSATKIYKRWERHRKNLREGVANHIMQNHYNKYGKEDFIYEVVETFDFISKDHLMAREKYYFLVFKYKVTKKPYLNVREEPESAIGIKHTEEQNRRQSENLKGKKRPPFTEEWCKNLSESHKGYFVRHPHHYVKGQESTFKGKTHTEEAKQKNRDKHIGSHDAVMRGIETRRKNGKMPKRDEKGHFMKKDW